MNFYQIILRNKLQKTNRNLTWYENLFATFLDAVQNLINLTNQLFTYRKVPVHYEGTSTIDTLKGNTLVWNQLVQNGNFADTSVWTNYGSSFTVSGNVATVKSTNVSNQFGLYQPFTKIKDHKYFVTFVAHKVGTITLKRNRFSSGQDRVQEGLFQMIDSASITATLSSPIQFLFSEPVSDISENYFTVKNYMIFDLTAMFGSGNEPTIDQFKSLFPLSYYAYNTGSLLNFNGTGIKTTGFNQWDEEWELGSINANGENAPSTVEIRSKNYIPAILGESYYVKQTGVQVFHYYDGNLNYLGNQYIGESKVLNIPSGTEYIRFRCANTYGTTYKNDICINISDPSKNGTYEPYTSSTLSLPISTYFPTGMKSAGTIYDELSDKAITRVGTITLDGTQTQSRTYNRINGDIVMYYANQGWKPNTSNTTMPNISSNIGVDTPNHQFSSDTTSVVITTTNGGELAICISGKTTASDVNTYLASNPVYVNYELATYTEQDVDLNLTYDIYDGGTEQLLPVNSSTPITSPILCDMTYRKGHYWEYTEALSLLLGRSVQTDDPETPLRIILEGE